jgi:hypothetical protein
VRAYTARATCIDEVGKTTVPTYLTVIFVRHTYLYGLLSATVILVTRWPTGCLVDCNATEYTLSRVRQKRSDHFWLYHVARAVSRSGSFVSLVTRTGSECPRSEKRPDYIERGVYASLPGCVRRRARRYIAL